MFFIFDSITLLSNNHFNLMRFGQIRRFPSREQPVDDFGRNSTLASDSVRPTLRPRLRHNADSRIVRRAQANAMLAQLAANVRGVPVELSEPADRPLRTKNFR
jgi:hypothetical protein